MTRMILAFVSTFVFVLFVTFLLRVGTFLAPGGRAVVGFLLRKNDGVLISPRRSLAVRMLTSSLTGFIVIIGTDRLVKGLATASPYRWTLFLFAAVLMICLDLVRNGHKGKLRRLALSHIPAGQFLMWPENLGPRFSDAAVNRMEMRSGFGTITALLVGVACGILVSQL